jgi:hypothetical protein
MLTNIETNKGKTDMDYAAAIEKIKATNFNSSQKRAALRLMNAMKKNTQSSIEGDAPKYELHIEASEWGSHASFCCFGEGTLYDTTLAVTLGPRGGKKVLRADRRFSDIYGGASKFYI